MSGQRRDTCPCCGGERVELVVVPGRFYCSTCQTATPGPVAAVDAPAGTQLTLGTT